MKSSRYHLQALLFATFMLMIGLAARPLNGTTDGKSIFLTSKCNTCHAIQSLGIARTTVPTSSTQKVPPDLSTVGSRHNADWISRWLQKKEELNGAKHLKMFKGTDEELASLSTWLSSLKKGK